MEKPKFRRAYVESKIPMNDFVVLLDLAILDLPGIICSPVSVCTGPSGGVRLARKL